LKLVAYGLVKFGDVIRSHRVIIIGTSMELS